MTCQIVIAAPQLENVLKACDGITVKPIDSNENQRRLLRITGDIEERDKFIKAMHPWVHQPQDFSIQNNINM